MSNIFITGGAGQLGSILGHYLQERGHKVVFFDNLSYGHKENLKRGDQFVLGDIRNGNMQRHLENVDCVYHFAAISSLPINQSDPFNSYNINVAGTLNILEACRIAEIPKIIFASTSAVYESNTQYPFKETDNISPHLTYSLSKKHCEDFVNSYAKLYGLNTTILRFFNAYSPNHDMSRKSPPLIAYLIKCFREKKNPILYSDGLQARDYIYGDDICSACEIVMDNSAAKNNTFNLCSGKVVNVREIFAEVSKHFTTQLYPQFRDARMLWEAYPILEAGYGLSLDWIAKETNKHSVGDNSKAKELLNWEPKVSLEDGIAACIK